MNKADFFEKLVRFEPDKIEESSGLNIKNTRKCLIISLEPKVKSKKSGLSGLTKSGLTGVECMYNLYYKNSLKTSLDKRVQLLLSFNFTVIFKKIFLFALTFYLLYLQYVH